MKNYIRQKYLFLTPDFDQEQIVAVKTSLEMIQQWGVERNLFDCGAPLIRRIMVSEMDDLIDTGEEWERFVVEAQKVDVLYIETPEGPQDQLHGFYTMLDGVFHKKYGTTWGLFRLGSGKRMNVFRWHFRTLNGHGDEVFLQFEETRLKIMLTVSSYYRRKDAKNRLLAKMERKGLTGVIAGKKSRSHGRLETMTVYEIDRSQWYRRRDNGIMDTEETISALEKLDSLLDALRQ